MIAVDPSALVAIFLREPESRPFLDIIDNSESVISAVSRLEVFSVLSGRRVGAAPGDIERFMSGFALRIEPVSLNQADAAVEALIRFGRGRHRAALNFGDCFSYALARTLDAPLLYKGDDFARTDIVPAWRPPSQSPS